MPKREKLIDKIMSNRYADDDPKNDDSNIAYLNTLSTEKLEAMSDFDDSMETEFDIDGEVLDFDFEDEEL
jgi:hypothetical protein